jgi:tyrosyl-tRNA synthetase
MDQRKVNMLAREYCDQVKRKLKPVILSHRMMPGLLEGQEKMSKSDPNSAVFMEDSEAEVNTKIKKAFCPPLVRAALLHAALLRLPSARRWCARVLRAALAPADKGGRRGHASRPWSHTACWWWCALPA